jgi:CRP/FNR family transcriptional regulator, anaerobic regulatory protein
MRSPQLHPRTFASLACSGCKLREICLPVGIGDEEIEPVDLRLVAVRRQVRRGESLLRTGESFGSVFAVWAGFFKTRSRTAEQREHVSGFQMGGELMGLDGIGSGRYEADAVALENSVVCEIPFSGLELLAHEVVPLQQQLHRMLSREIAHKQRVMKLLGGRPAEERVAAFLLDLAQRLAARGYSATAMVLRMSRREMGSFLGLTLETVSRTLSRLQANGLLSVRRRQIRIVDAAGLQRLLRGSAE